MNKYGLPLAQPSEQTILPAMTEDGKLRGWYTIGTTIFDGTETEFKLIDCTVPLKTVTVDTPYPVKQYVAAVWPVGLPHNEEPWSSSSLLEVGDGYFRWYSLPSQGPVLHYGPGGLIGGLQTNLAIMPPAPPIPASPTIEDSAIMWYASIDYEMLNGNCTFFDFNWVTQLLGTTADYTKVSHIEIAELPAPIDPVTDPTIPLLAKVIGRPVAVVDTNVSGAAGTQVYDTVRIIMNMQPLPKGTYEVKFNVHESRSAPGTPGRVTPAVLTITVK